MVLAAECISGRSQLAVPASHIEKCSKQQQGQYADHAQQPAQLPRGVFALVLIAFSDIAQQRRYLPVSLARTIAVGTLAGEDDIARSTLEVAIKHQFVSQFPHGALIHHTVADVGQHTLHQPLHHLRCVALLLKLNIPVEGHQGIGMRTRLHRLQPFIINAH